MGPSSGMGPRVQNISIFRDTLFGSIHVYSPRMNIIVEFLSFQRMIQNAQTGPEIRKKNKWALQLPNFTNITKIFLRVGVVIWHVIKNRRTG